MSDANPVNEFVERSLDDLARLIDAVRLHRRPDAYARQNSAYPTLELYDAAKSAYIDGNLGRMVLVAGKDRYCGDWIAPSYMARTNVLNRPFGCPPDTVIYAPSDSLIRIAVPAFTFGGRAPLWRTSSDISPSLGTSKRNFSSVDSKTNDSEYLLLNTLTDRLHKEWKHLLQMPTKLILLTERIPCESCTGVIDEFRKLFPTIEFFLIYLYDTSAVLDEDHVPKELVGRGPGDFLEQLAGLNGGAGATPPPLLLMKVFFKVESFELVRVTSNSTVKVADEVRREMILRGESPGILASIRPSIDLSAT